MSPRQWKRFGNSSLISDSAVYLASNLLNAAIPFLLLPVLTRYLNLAEYGQVAIFMTLIAALGAITGLNTNGSAGRKYYDHGLSGNEFALFIGSCLWILVVSSLLVFLVLWAFQGRFAHWLALPPHWVLWAVAASTAGFIIQLRLGQWQVRKQARSYGILQVGQSLMNMLLSLLLVVGLSLGGEGRMMGLLATSLAFAALGLYLLARDGLSAIAWRSAYVKEALAFGVPLVPHVAGLFLLSVTDRIVVTTELGVAQTGLYHVAAQLAGALGILFDAFNKAYVPWLYERLQRDRADDKKRIVCLTYAYFAAALLMAGIMFLFGPLIVRLLAGPRYAEAGTVIGWIALGHAFGGMYLMVTNYVFYSKRTGLLSLSTISAGIINVVLLVVLVNLIGLVGAGIAFAFALAMAIRFLLTWWVAQIRHPMPWFTALA